MTKARSNAVAEAAKGDLSVGSGTNLAGILAVGNNGETLVADSSASVGLRYTATPSASNPVLNSAFQVWQRGTSIASGAAAPYTADRWQVGRAGNVAGTTVSRQVTGDTTNLPSIQYCSRVQRDSGNTSTAVIFFMQSFETLNAVPYAGKTIALSFYARAGANFSATSSALGARIDTGTGTDQNVFSGYTGAATPINTPVILTTTWQRFTVTGTIASTATEFGLLFNYSPTGTAGANDHFEITGVQIDVGSVALPFRTYAGTIQGELAACQRYYYRTTNGVGNGFGLGANASTSIAELFIRYPVTMRTAPSSLDNANIGIYQISNGTDYSGGTTTMIQAENDSAGVRYTHGSSPLTTGNTVVFKTQGADGYLGFSAEL